MKKGIRGPQKKTTKNNGVKIPQNRSVPQTVIQGNKRNMNIAARPEGQYLQALTDPFSDKALGCVIPDTFPWPTATYHCKYSSTIQPSTTGAIGTVLLPSPTVSQVNFTGTIVGGTTWESGGTVVGTTRTSFTGAISDSTVSSHFSNMRTVACGWKLRNLQPFQTINGRLICAPFIVGKGGLNQSALYTIMADTANCISSMGEYLSEYTPAGSAPNTTVLALPGAFEITADELISTDLMLCSRPVGPGAFHFRTSRNVAVSASNAVQICSSDTTNNGVSSLISSHGPNETSDCQDMIGWIILGVGFTTTTSTVIELETIYHLEGQAMVGSTGIMPSGNSHVVKPSITVGELLIAAMNHPLAMAMAPVATGFARGFMSRMAA